MSATVAGGLCGLAHAAKSCVAGISQLWKLVAVATARAASSGCAPLTDGAATGTWRGETDASGLHGWGLAVALARMLLPGVPLG